jgi:hypothetical protein
VSSDCRLILASGMSCRLQRKRGCACVACTAPWRYLQLPHNRPISTPSRAQSAGLDPSPLEIAWASPNIYWYFAVLGPRACAQSVLNEAPCSTRYDNGARRLESERKHFAHSGYSSIAWVLPQSSLSSMSHTHTTATSCLRQLQASMAERMPVMAHTEWVTEWDSRGEGECLRQDRSNEDNHRLRMETAVEELSHGASDGSSKKLLSRSSVFNANTWLQNTIRKRDIWAFGCVMLETLVWLIHGRSNQDKDDSSVQHATLVRDAELRKSSLLKRALMFERTVVPDQLDSDVDKQISWSARIPASSSRLLSCALGSTSIVGMSPGIIPVRPVVKSDFRLRNAMSLGRKDTCSNEHLSSALRLL